jgi:hypothetical protein
MTISCIGYTILHTEVAPGFRKEPTNDFHRKVSDSHVVFVWFLIHRRLLVLPAFVCRIILLIIRSYDHMLADATRLFSYSLMWPMSLGAHKPNEEIKNEGVPCERQTK